MSISLGNIEERKQHSPPLTDNALLLLRQMYLIRVFEEQIRSLFASGMVPGLVHLCSGQEAVAVGVCSLLRAEDAIASNHRGHGHCLAKGADVSQLAAGAALSAKRRGRGEVAVCFFGDGALNQGLLFEVMNMAAIWHLPVLFVCENNGYGEFTAIEDVTAGGDPIGRGEVFNIPSEVVDGMDVLAVREAAARAIERARAGSGPSFLVCTTYR